MGFFSNKVERSEIEAGDHIYTWRTAFLYSHHGIYVGRNLVVHFINPYQNFSISSSSNANFRRTCSNSGCNFGKDNNGVTIYCLDCFLGNGSLYRYEYGAVLSSIARIGGTCTRAKSDPADVVVNRAMYFLHHGFGLYNVILNNCEDFALYCKIGAKVEASSGQVSFVLPPVFKLFKPYVWRRGIA